MLQMLAPALLGNELLEIWVERAARGNDSDRMAIFDHWKMAEAVLVHQHHRDAEGLVG